MYKQARINSSLTNIETCLDRIRIKVPGEDIKGARAYGNSAKEIVENIAKFNCKIYENDMHWISKVCDKAFNKTYDELRLSFNPR